MKRVQVFVGFGGSGGQILKELARMLSEDFTWASLADRHTFFLLVDTDTADLEDAFQSIKNSLSREGGVPWVQRVGLADGIDSIAHLVDHHLSSRRLKDERAQEALQQHWWHRDGMPFVARRLLASPQKGAGQCPLVSRFLAWQAAGQIEGVIRDLLRSIRARMEGEPFSVDLVLTGSLAGGTGRGCWSLLSFRIRQVLADQGVFCQPFGYFLDQGCFADVVAAHPEQEYKLKVNSLTGLSELVMWIRNDHQGRPLIYRLPSLESAERQELDIIDAHRCRMEVEPAKGASPLDAAFIVFESSKSGTPENNHDYYSMLATCLYARTVNSEIWSAQANSPQPLYSLGSAVFDIPATSLLEFMIERARQALIGRLVHRTDDAEIAQQVATLLGPLRVDEASLRALSANENGNLVQRLVHELRVQAPVRQFATSLEDDSKEDAVEQAGALEKADRARVEAAVNQVFATMTGVATPGAYLRSQIAGLLTGESGKGSVADALRVVRGIREQLLHQARTLPARPSTAEDQRSLTARTEEAARKDYLGLFGRRFNEAEQQALLGAARNRFVIANFEEIIRKLRTEFESLADLLRRHEDVLARIQKLFDMRFTDSQDLANQRAVGLFTRPDRLPESVPGMYDATRYVRRVLKPVLNEGAMLEQIHSRLDHSRQVAEALGGLYQAVKVELQRAESLDELSFTDLEKARSNVDQFLEGALERVDLSQDFIRRQFNFEQVVGNLMAVWSEGISAARGEERGRLVRLFEQFFGIDAKRWLSKEGMMRTPDTSEAVMAMGASLAATCDPFFVKRPHSGMHEEDRVVLFLPGLAAFGQDFATKLERSDTAKTRGLGSGFKVYPTCEDAQERNPFAMVAWAVERFPDLHDPLDFGGVESVSYWRNSARVSEWLDLTEATGGDSVFSDQDFNVGIGHVDPMMVTDEQWSVLRWKPWAESRAKQREIERTRSALAIAYAMIGNAPPEQPNPAAAAALTRVAQICGWALPLLERTDGQWRFTRRAYRLEMDQRMELGQAWDTGDTYGSVNQLKKDLDGPKGPGILRELDQELRLFDATVANDPEVDLTNKEKTALVEQLIQFLDAEKVRTRKAVRDEEHRTRMLEFLDGLLAAIRVQPIIN